MAERTFYVRISDEEIQDKIDTNEKSNNQLLKDIIEAFFKGDLVPTNETNLDLEIKKQKLRKLTAEATIKEHEVKYYETFDKPPSSQAKKAIEKRVLTQNELGKVEQYITLRVNGTGFQGVCDFCRLDITQGTKEKTLLELSRHLIAVHSKEILKD